MCHFELFRNYLKFARKLMCALFAGAFAVSLLAQAQLVSPPLGDGPGRR